MSAAVIALMVTAAARLEPVAGLIIMIAGGVLAYAVASWLLNRAQVRETVALALPGVG